LILAFLTCTEMEKNSVQHVDLHAMHRQKWSKVSNTILNSQMSGLWELYFTRR
jgi:hypothetical protein